MSSTLVKTNLGMVEGVKDGRISIWKGIPYAAPPIKSLRFRPPQQPKPWGGVKETKAFRAAAIQSESPSMKFLGDTPMTKDEDCLYLNIWSPGADNERRPVMVWIHGGSFMYGSGSSHLYDGKAFAEHGNVVVVTLNYRLGVFGFLHLSEIGGETYSGSGNCGLLDQVAALKWINENIEAFGGDPDNITIFGESAGAVSVGNLLAMPKAKGLFQKAILQSGTARRKQTAKKANEMAEQLLAKLRIDPLHISDIEDIPAEVFLDAIKIFPRTAFGPVGDDIVLSPEPEEVLSEGYAKEIPVIVGTNLHESTLFTYFDPVWQEMNERKLKTVFEQAFEAFSEKVSKYVLKDNRLSRTAYEKVLSDYVFTYPAIYFGGSQAKYDADVWMYRFDYESPVLNGALKAFHALEIPFVWNNLDHEAARNLTGDHSDRYQLADQMHEAWISFAHHGDPNIEKLPHWPKYDLKNRSTMIFNTRNEVVNDPDGQMRKNWEQVFQN